MLAYMTDTARDQTVPETSMPFTRHPVLQPSVAAIASSTAIASFNCSQPACSPVVEAVAEVLAVTIRHYYIINQFVAFYENLKGIW